MASLLFHFSPIIFLLLLISPALSLTCTSQTFTQTTTHYTNCSDLPSLKAYLHWAYDPKNSSFSVAFIAQPAKPDGWIAWGINPTATGMVGAQCLIALKDSNGSLVVKTFNLQSYKSIVETSKLSFKVVDSRAEDVNGTMKIFATLALPENTTVLNQVWQVGGAVKDGGPAKHEFAPENLNAKGTLELVKAESNATATGATTGGGASTNATSSGSATGESSMSRPVSKTWNIYLGVYGFLLFFGIFILGF